MSDLVLRRSAVFSEDGVYRMRLERDFCRPGKVVAAIMVNPSRASAEIDDHTIRKWHGFSDRHGFAKVIIGNKFAYCATDITELRNVEDAVGPDNDRHLEQIMRDADFPYRRLGAAEQATETSS